MYFCSLSNSCDVGLKVFELGFFSFFVVVFCLFVF